MNTIVYDVIKLIWAILGIAVVAAAVIFIIIRNFIKRSSKQATDEDSTYTDYVSREDMNTYVALDNIRDGIVCLEGHRRFVSAIEVQGYDLFHASGDEQEMVMNRYTRLFDMLPDDEYLQVRFSPQARDLSEYIKQYTELYEKVAADIYQKLESIDLLANNQRKAEAAGHDTSLYSERIIALNKEVESLTSQKNELNELVKWLKYNSDEELNPEMRSIYVFSWKYSAGVFEGDLDDEQIFERAKVELRNLANSYIGALEEAHLHARQIESTEAMIDVWRRYFRPISRDAFKVGEIMNDRNLDGITDCTDDEQTVYRIAEADRRVVQEKKERRKKEAVADE